MKNRIQVIISILLFFIVNTQCFWEVNAGKYYLGIFMVLLIIFFVLVCILVLEIFISVFEKFSNPNRNLTIVTMTIFLGMIYLFPNGLINCYKSEGENLFVAQREGAANCNTVFKIKPQNRFTERTVCFGIEEISGLYYLKEDTIFFTDVKCSRENQDYFEYALFKKSEFSQREELFRYENRKDTVGIELWITKNDLFK